MSTVQFPLPLPKTTDEILHNIEIIKQDLNVSEKEILAVAQKFSRGKEIPPEYLQDSKGYMHTLAALILYNKQRPDVRQCTGEMVAANLELFVQTHILDINNIAEYMLAVLKNKPSDVLQTSISQHPEIVQTCAELTLMLQQFVQASTVEEVEKTVARIELYRQGDCTLRELLFGDVSVTTSVYNMANKDFEQLLK